VRPDVSTRRRQRDAAQSVVGEEDPGAALDMLEPATADATRNAAGSTCHRCGGSGRVGVALCPTCGGSGRVIRGIGGG
jgi:RecJ-like exonuclease